jgi:hypothetical protein
LWRLKVESNNWAKEQELKERVVRELWKLKDEERRRLRVELMQYYKALVETAEAATELRSRQSVGVHLTTLSRAYFRIKRREGQMEALVA